MPCQKYQRRSMRVCTKKAFFYPGRPLVSKLTRSKIPRCELRPFFGSHTRTSHLQIKVRTHTCAHNQFGVVALRTRTFGEIRFFSNFSIFFHHFFSNFSLFLWFFFVFTNRIGCSKSE